MISARWEEIKDIFDLALLREEHERDGFLLERCAEDAELLREVGGLLLADRESSNFLELPVYANHCFLPLLFGRKVLSPNQILCGRFEILAYLGEGGMGEVYEAMDLELRQPIAIKAIRSEIADIPGVVTRFKREVYATRKVTHPNVCRSFDLECHTPTSTGSTCVEAKVTFLTMELLRGETLAQRIRQSGSLPADQVYQLAIQVANALNAAHEAGVIHCDLKPSNIFITSEANTSRAVVTDFGIAKFTQVQDQQLRLHAVGQPIASEVIAGTPSYMAPEQFELGQCTPASDLYSYGLIVYEALTGERPPTQARSRRDIRKWINIGGTSRSSRSLLRDPAWEVILFKCLQVDPKERWTRAQDILDQLTGKTAHRRYRINQHGIPLTRQATTKVWSVGLTLALVLVPAILRKHSPPVPSSSAMVQSVAVLPFENRTEDPKIRNLNGKIETNLTNYLAQVAGLRVPSQIIVRNLSKQDLRSACRQLGIETFVDGSISKEATGLVIQVELVDAATGLQLWGQSYRQVQEDVGTLEQDIGLEISFHLKARSAESVVRSAGHEHSAVPSSQEAFVKGRKSIAEGTAAGYEQAVKYLQQALDADPTFAPALAELANCYNLMAYNYNRPEAPLALMNMAEASARRALQLDTNLAAAYVALADVQLLKDFDWEGAEKNLRRATQLDPSYLGAHTAYALSILTARGRFAEGRTQLSYSDRISPKPIGIEITESLAAYFSRQYETSVTQAQVIRQRSPGNEVVAEILAADYVAMNRPSDAISLLDSVTSLSQDSKVSKNAMLGIAFAKLGEKNEAIARLRSIEESQPFDFNMYYHLAALYAALGHRQKAMRYLEMSYARRQTSILFIGVDPLMDPLRNDPDFQGLLSKMKLH